MLLRVAGKRNLAQLNSVDLVVVLFGARLDAIERALVGSRLESR